MALKSTIFKATLQISDLDRHYYAEHALTIARHPSETDERMMVRLAAFALNASERLEFGKGLSTDDEPDLWQRDLTGAIETWIEVGLPDERRLRKASGRAAAVKLYAYGGRAAEVWWDNNARELNKLDKLSAFFLDAETTSALTALAERTMQLQAMLQDGELWLSAADGRAVKIAPAVWKKSSAI
ncbi:MAG: YaeQ family protein [Betaproteobacteria bacterium]|nr:YaeQ family protein [Betaproteobacteria bacterium]